MNDIGYIFIAGGGMSSWVWRDLDQRISSRAVLVAGRLAQSSAETRRSATLDDCVDHIMRHAEGAAVRRFIIVGHSGGGILVPLTAKRMPGRTAALVFVSAAIPRDGTSLLQGLPLPLRLLNARAMKRQLPVDRTPARNAEKTVRKVFCNTASEEVIQYVLSQELLTEPMCAYQERVSWVGVPRVPMTFIRLLRDKTASLKLQDGMASHLGICDKVDIQSDHMVMLSHPAELNEALLQIERRLAS